MHPKLAEAFARTDWHDHGSVDDLVREQLLAFKMALSRVATLDPAVAAAFAPAIAAGLPDYVRNVIVTAAAVRQQETWNQEAGVRHGEIARLEEEVEAVRQHMREILEQEYVQAVRRSQMPTGKAAFALQALFGRTLTAQQALLVGYNLIEGDDVPLDAKRAWEKAALYDQVGDTLLAHALTRAAPADRRAVEEVRQVLSTGVRGAIDDAVEASRPGASTVPVAEVSARLVGVVDALPSLSPEQHAAASKAVADTVTKYVSKRGLDGGFPVDAAARTEHAAGLRAALSASLMRAVMRGKLDLDPSAVDAVLDGISAGINAIKTPGQGTAEEIASVHGTAVDALAAQGVSMTGTASDALATIGRTALRDAARIARDPERATDADMKMLRAVATVAARVEPEIECLHRADLQATTAASPSVAAVVSRVQAWTQQHTAERTVQPDADAAPKPR